MSYPQTHAQRLPPTPRQWWIPNHRPTFIAILALCLVPLFVGAFSFSTSKSPNKQNERSRQVELARPSESISAHAPGRDNSTINLSDGRDVLASYVGPEDLREALGQNRAEPRSLASADFDEDGVPDLVSGYAYDGKGIVTLLPGNLDFIYPNSPEAQQRRVSGALTGSPFSSPARIFTMPVAADFVGAGDFNGDGHNDVVAASRSGSSLYLLSGDGHGSFAQPGEIALPGLITAMATGDLNRPDGLTEVIVGVNGAGGSQVQVFEGPEGALRSSPEIFVTRSPVNSLVIGQFDGDQQADLAIAVGKDLLIVSGRDRKLSLNDKSKSQVKAAAIATRTFSFVLRSIAAGNFTGRGHTDLALLAADGAVHLMSRDAMIGKNPRLTNSLAEW